CSSDADAEVRESTFRAMGAVLRCVGEQAARRLFDIRKAITENFEKLREEVGDKAAPEIIRLHGASEKPKPSQSSTASARVSFASVGTRAVQPVSRAPARPLSSTSRPSAVASKTVNRTAAVPSTVVTTNRAMTKPTTAPKRPNVVTATAARQNSMLNAGFFNLMGIDELSEAVIAGKLWFLKLWQNCFSYHRFIEGAARKWESQCIYDAQQNITDEYSVLRIVYVSAPVRAPLSTRPTPSSTPRPFSSSTKLGAPQSVAAARAPVRKVLAPNVVRTSTGSCKPAANGPVKIIGNSKSISAPVVESEEGPPKIKTGLPRSNSGYNVCHRRCKLKTSVDRLYVWYDTGKKRVNITAGGVNSHQSSIMKADSREASVQSSVKSEVWNNLAPPPEAATLARTKMPKLLTVGPRENYPDDFLDTVDRIGTICDCLDKLECLCYHLKKDGKRKQTNWLRAAEAFKQYGEGLMTPEVAAVFLRAAQKFSQISTLYQHVMETIEQQFRNPLHDFNQKNVKTVKESLKKLDHCAKIMMSSKTKAERKPEDLEARIAAEVTQKVHEETFKSTKESVLKFLESTCFFETAASAFVSADKELNDKAHQAILKIIYTY
ncbi:hypothetical protein GCK32_003866, partial [Trichostrongylus colubriformis]